MLAADIKHVIEVANGNPIKFISANLTFVLTRNMYSYVFLDDENQRLAVLRPYNDSDNDEKYPFEVTYMMYDQIEIATVLLKPEDVDKYIDKNASKLLYPAETGAIKETIRKSPYLKNFDSEPGSAPYENKIPRVLSQPLHPM